MTVRDISITYYNLCWSFTIMNWIYVVRQQNSDAVEDFIVFHSLST